MQPAASSTPSATFIADVALLATIEQYYDAAPRSAARVEQIGPFTLFVQAGAGWPYYARPTLGASGFDMAAVTRVRERQRALGVPETFEWVAETTPALARAAALSQLQVTSHPLMILRQPSPRLPAASDLQVRLVTEDDDLALLGAVAPVAFGAPGTSVGAAGVADVRRLAQAADAAGVSFRRARLRAGQTAMAVALIDGEPVGVGSHQPVGTTTELTGIGVLPAFRRRGVAAALTARLVADALERGIRTVFLSAGDDAIARVYARVGFERAATACIAQPLSYVP